MSLVSGPGRGGGGHGIKDLPDEMKLVVGKHVEYIRKLDTVGLSSWHGREHGLSIDTETGRT
jgi:hypothetical protein